MRAFMVFAYLAQIAVIAQVPFVTEEDRFMIFSQGRFEKLEPRPPRQIFPMEGHVVYEDHEGDLKVFLSDRKLFLLQSGNVGDIKATRRSLAWLSADTLKILTNGTAKAIATQVDTFSVSDELVVYAQGDTLKVHSDQGEQALIERSDPDSSFNWIAGKNTVAFSGQNDSLLIYWNGEIFRSGARAGTAVAGKNVAAWWNETGLWAWYDREIVQLSTQFPIEVQAADELIAFTLVQGGLKCFLNGQLHSVSEKLPTGFWAKDELLVYLVNGRLELFDQAGRTIVEPYVPEWWQIEGDRLIYLDMNRELRSITKGEPERVSREPSVKDPEVFGEAILYVASTGNRVVVLRGKTYIF